VDCGMRNVYRFNKKANLMIFHIMFKSRPELSIVVLEDYRNNLVQEKDNNTNGINEMASMLWDIIVSCESKHIWKMANET
jgi:hypothetical protein